MGRRIDGRFQATDDFNLDGHHIVGMTFLSDLPRGGASDNQVLAWNGEEWTPTTLSGTSVVSVSWGDVTDKPDTFPPSTHTQPWDTITNKPNLVNTVNAGFGIAVTTSTGDVTVSNPIAEDQSEPTGFIKTPDTGFDSSVTITDNRTFSIAPVSSSFSFYVNGQKFTKTSTESITFPDTEGIHAFYYNSSGTLSTTLTPLDYTIFLDNALIAICRWDADNNEVIYFGEERHGMVMDGRTHQYLHEVEGARFIGGHALSDINADESGALDSHATLSVESGTIADEDLFLSAAATASATQTWYTFYKEGTTGVWRRTALTNFPVVHNGTLSRITYNDFNGTSWVQADPGNNNFVLAHIWRTNSVTTPYIAIQGQDVYGNIAAARTGATDELNSLVTSGLPVVEFFPLGTLIFQTSSAYGNSVDARIRTTDTGDDYVDWRFQEFVPGSGPGDHGALAGLTDPDHPLTALQQSGATTNQAVVWNGTTWVPDGIVNSVVAGTNISVSAASGSVTISAPNAVTNIDAGENILVSANNTVSLSDTPVIRTLVLEDEASNSPALFYRDGSSNDRFWLYMPYTTPNILRMAASTNGSAWDFDLMVWDNVNSRVGIGNASPAVELDVSGQLFVDAGTDNLVARFESTDAEAYIQLLDNSGFANILLRSDQAVSIRPSGSEAIRILSGGNVFVLGDEIRLNAGGPDGDAHLYFYDGGATGQYLMWDDSESQFGFSTDLHVSGELTDDLRTDQGTDFDATSDSTPSPSNLEVPMAAGGRYYVEAILVVCGTNTLAADGQITWSVPTGATAHMASGIPAGGSAFSTTKLIIALNGTTMTGHHIQGVVTVASTAGTFTFNWAQNVASAYTSTLKAESQIYVRRA